MDRGARCSPGRRAEPRVACPYMGHPEVRAMLTDDRAPTCSLVEFLEAWNEDPNLVWRVRTGHLIHLLEAAVGRIEALETLLSEMEERDVDEEVTKPLWSADGRAASLTAAPEAVGRRENPVSRWGWIPGRRKETPTCAMAPKHACLAQKVRTST